MQSIEQIRARLESGRARAKLEHDAARARAKQAHDAAFERLQRAIQVSTGRLTLIAIVFVYLWITIASVTDENLLFDTTAAVPFIENVKFSITVLFSYGIIAFVVLHFYFLVSVTSLATRAARVRRTTSDGTQIEDEIDRALGVGSDERVALLTQIFLHPLIAGIVRGRDPKRPYDWLYGSIAILIFVPILFVLRAQMKFLPYHAQGAIGITEVHQFLIVVLAVGSWWTLDLLWAAFASLASGGKRNAMPLWPVALPRIGLVILAIVSIILLPRPYGPLDNPVAASLTAPGLWHRDLVVDLKEPPSKADGQPAVLLSDGTTLALPPGGANLANRNLRDARLTLENIAIRSFANSDLSHGRLVGTRMDYVDLTGLNCEECDFENVRARFAHLAGATFEGATLRRVDMAFADAERIDMTNAQLETVSFDRSILYEAVFRGATLSHTFFRAAFLVDVNLSNAHLDEAEFTLADLHSANLKSAEILSSHIDWTRLFAADLSHAVVYCVDFRASFLDATWTKSQVEVTNYQFTGLGDRPKGAVDLARKILPSCHAAPMRLTELETVDALTRELSWTFDLDHEPNGDSTTRYRADGAIAMIDRDELLRRVGYVGSPTGTGVDAKPAVAPTH